MKADEINQKLQTLDFTSDMAGKLLSDRYYLYERIAEKNYTQVYLARDIAKHRKCVVKKLDLSLCPPKVRQAVGEMFWQEAKILQKLSGKHSQICRFYGYLSEDCCYYLVQEWVPGITLSQKLQPLQRFSESQTKELLLNLLPVLEYIHGLGIVHHDLKPDNIILRSSDNLPVLIDFGVAREIGARNRPKTIVGTPGYMSLEQAMGQVAYHNDLYSLGLTAVHLLTGSPSNTSFKGCNKISQNTVRVIERAIASEPQQRFASASAMRSALLSSSTQTTTDSLDDARSPRLPLVPLWTVFLAIGFQIFVVGMGWYQCETAFCGNAQLEEQPPLNLNDLLPESPTVEDEPLAIATPPDNSIFDNIIFTVGTTDREILQALGEPLWRKPGFWANSIAWSYEDIVARGIDIGYMFDVQTNLLQQAEIAVPPTTSFTTLQAALASLLPQPDLAIEQGLREVYQRRQTVYNFTVGKLEGIIQRNQKDRIYIAVWLKGFH